MSETPDTESQEVRGIMRRAEAMGIDPVRVGSVLGFLYPVAEYQEVEVLQQGRRGFGLRCFARRARRTT